MATSTCGYLRCTNPPTTSDNYCSDHDTQWDRDDMQRYHDYREEGYWTHQAAVMAGIESPNE